MPPVSPQNVLAFSAHVALVVGAGMALCRLAGLADARGRLAFYRALLGLCLILPLLAPLRPATPPSPAPAATWPAVAAPADATTAPNPAPVPTTATTVSLGAASTWALPVLLVAGALARLAWLGLGLVALRRLRCGGRPVGPSPAFARAADRTGATATVYESPSLGLPATYGVWRPVVLVPEGFASWPDGTQHALAAHELLHVRRRDWLHGLGEEFVKACLWFHPAVWWLVDRIHLAREQVVDRQVVAMTGDRSAYLHDLLGLAAAHATAAPARAAAFFRRPHLLQRVDVLLKEGPMSRTRLVVSFVSAAVALATATTATLRALPLEAALVSHPTQAAAAKPPVLATPQADARKQPLPPAPLTRVPVDYPEAARAAGVSGPVVLQVTTAAGGTPTDVRVLSGAPELVDAAVSAVWQWRWEPGDTPSQFIMGLNVRPAPPESAGDKVPARIGGSIRPPVKVGDVRPVYPDTAKDERVQGITISEVTIGTDGRTEIGRVLRSAVDPRLDTAALEAVLRWVYEPTVIDGRAVPVLMTVTVNFTLK